MSTDEIRFLLFDDWIEEVWKSLITYKALPPTTVAMPAAIKSSTKVNPFLIECKNWFDVIE